jgi:hypothetical protein
MARPRHPRNLVEQLRPRASGLGLEVLISVSSMPWWACLARPIIMPALAVYAFRISLGGKSALAGARLDEG